jgi:hypothetical protein
MYALRQGVSWQHADTGAATLIPSASSPPAVPNLSPLPPSHTPCIPAFPPSHSQMPIWDHLEELRERVLVSLLAAGVAIGGCFAFSKELVLFLEAPVAEAGVRFLQLSPGEFFFTTFKVIGWVCLDVWVRQCVGGVCIEPGGWGWVGEVWNMYGAMSRRGTCKCSQSATSVRDCCDTPPPLCYQTNMISSPCGRSPPHLHHPNPAAAHAPSCRWRATAGCCWLRPQCCMRSSPTWSPA